VLNRLECSVGVKKQNVMNDEIVEFGDLNYFFFLSYLECYLE
jgi:hypothetical protein